MEYLNGMLARNVRLLGDRPYLITEQGTVTYRMFDERTSRLANVLSAHGARKGEPVGLYLADNLAMATCFWACLKLGAVPTPMSAMYREKELGHILAATAVRIVVADSDITANIEIMRPGNPALDTVLVSDRLNGGALSELASAAPGHFDAVESAPDDVACLFFTSGTTGLPKGTMQTQFSQFSALRDMMVTHRSRFGQEVYLCATPLFTNLGMTINLNLAMYSGGSVVLHDRWNTRRALDAIRQHKVSVFTGMPTMFVYLMNEFDPARDDLSSMRLCLIGGSPVSPTVVRKFEELSHGRLIQVYGATEGTGQVVIEPIMGKRKAGSSGVAVGSSRIEIVDGEHRPVPVGTLGEIVIGGDTLAKGYWRDPEATARAFTPRGWLSGDVGYVDDEGYLYVVDRIKDVIISGGHNIFPLEVEDILYAHPSVAVCAVVGIPDEVKGEIPVAVVARAPATGDSGADLIAYCRTKIAAYKAPRRVYFIDEMPLNGGKIQKRALVAAIADGRLRPAL